MPQLQQIARLPDPTDNCAIAIRDLAAGTAVAHAGSRFALSHTILEGHRFAIRPIPRGEALTSWRQRFGIASRDIQPGDYVINAGVQLELSRRNLDFALPAQPNFDNLIAPYAFDERRFTPAPPLPLHSQQRHFAGYLRSGGRGTGTRNMLVLLGTSSLTGGFARALASRLASLADDCANVDGIVPVAHTEGGHSAPNNRELLLRTLAGFMAHPNVGAILAIDYGNEAITNAELRAYMLANGYPLAHLRHHFYSLGPGFEDNIARCREVVRAWLPQLAQDKRSPQPLSALKIALQCGGSDAFSGISGNPLAAWVAKEVIRYGGAANLAETDELIGAEAYVLDKVERLETARQFLRKIERFQEWVGWHGQTAEGNPSGGNKYRGLYNIALKSLGAAAKRHPDVPLHAVIDYSQPMTAGGFYFMDSPGNDLESVAGQVASGCNMIFFVTGNGSITNFPFVPTIKFVTTTARYKLLSQDMDVNAGAYLDGEALDELGARTLDLTVDIASGTPSVGERAGHHQVQVWRDWQQTRPANVAVLERRSYSGKPLDILPADELPRVDIPVYQTERGSTSELVGMILPTSLCSGQIARMSAEKLNALGLGRGVGLSRFVALVHTEGCGGSVVPEYLNIQLGYLQHPKLRHTLLLEHGCEITHNSYFRSLLAERGLDPAQFGWASIQLDGGIQAVMARIETFFRARLEHDKAPPRTIAGLDAMRIGLVTQGTIPEASARSLAELCRLIVAGGGTVVASDKDAMFEGSFASSLGLAAHPQASLAYGEIPRRAGFHIMANPRRHWAETLAGLGASGIELILAHVDGLPLAGHPLLPALQVGAGGGAGDLDSTAAGDVGQLLNLLVATMSGDYIPRHRVTGWQDFQVTRGLVGVSF
ncbi:MAG: UxaA family hydrolase [Chloroflexi bacterium]|nr:UxaA family hydrolase [Chloroflexota bacterium]MCY3581623.1 UxaA family hydrolase [Chloroflexota bacterium]MCY3717031.1 UxaA family hydrolase [Chloroflexota bacterium]MDE2652148.1 UxaA family hydrolase [Chloroflexota bacterium]MXV92444.1 altronate dehydratase [Chloroflexota bacterium]